MRLPARAVVAGGAGLLCAAIPALAVLSPGTVRALVALLVVLDLAVVAAVRPRVAIGLVVMFFVALGLVRRLLIPAAGWSAFDPLLTVGPAVSLVLLARALLARRLAAPDLLSRSVLVLLLLSGLEVLNPSGTGVLTNLTGLLFTGAPLLWFFAGQAFGDRVLARRLLTAVALAACLVAVYGLVQTWSGLPSWDQAWVTASGYTALRVGHTIRAFGTFASAAEYAACLGAAMTIITGSLTLRRAAMLLLLPLLAVALFLESSRGMLVSAGFGILVVAALRTGRAWRAGAVLVAGLAAVLAAVAVVVPAAQSTASNGGDLVAHQVNGLADPLNPETSTLLLHWQLVVNALTDSVTHPLGLGPAATNLAGDRTSGTGGGGEVDVVNEFSDMGLAGGLLLVVIIVVALSRAVRVSLRTRDPALVALAGVLVLTLGQWLNGGYYAMSALVWLLAGTANRAFLDHRAAARAAAAVERD